MKKDGGLVAFLVIMMFIGLYVISWIATCGIIKLITMCFGWSFSWLYATGIWLVLCVLQSVFGGLSK